jgi:hypothetical protein
MKDIIKNIKDNVSFPFKDEEEQIDFFELLI